MNTTRQNSRSCRLAEPLIINGLTLRSRIVMTAIHTGFSPAKETEFLVRRARGGAAAVTAVMGVNGQGTTGNMTLIHRSVFDEIREMARQVEAEGACLFVQLFHAGRNGWQGRMKDPQAIPVAPSKVASPIYRQEPRVLSTEEIPGIAADFAAAAALCREAGVHGVEISASAGYLLSQFLSPRTNLREDCYGGREENRFRFPLEVVRSVREAVGADYPVTIRISVSDMLGGYGVEEMKRFLRAGEQWLDGVNVTGGWHESPVPQITMQVPEGGFAYLAREIRRAVSLPVIACNRINDRKTAEAVLAEGCGDLAGCARAFLIDADFGNKVLEGQRHRRCIACNKGCIDRVLKQQTVSCVFNPDVEALGETGGAAREFAAPKEWKRKRVLIAGGGPAGMETAIRLARRGAKVSLYEKEGRLGGALWLAAKAPDKKTIVDNIAAMTEEVLKAGVEVHTDTAADLALIREARPDFVVIAVGGNPLIPPISGIEGKNVMTAQRLLAMSEGRARRLLSESVCIIGGGAVGLETALYLARLDGAAQQGMAFVDRFAGEELRKDLRPTSGITVVEMAAKAGTDLGSLRHIVMGELKEAGVTLRTGAKVEEISEGRVLCRLSLGEGGKELISIPARTVVLAAGSRPAGGPLARQLSEERGIPFCVLGDGEAPGTVQHALRDARALCGD